MGKYSFIHCHTFCGFLWSPSQWPDSVGHLWRMENLRAVIIINRFYSDSTSFCASSCFLNNSLIQSKKYLNPFTETNISFLFSSFYLLEYQVRMLTLLMKKMTSTRRMMLEWSQCSARVSLPRAGQGWWPSRWRCQIFSTDAKYFLLRWRRRTSSWEQFTAEIIVVQNVQTMVREQQRPSWTSTSSQTGVRNSSVGFLSTR